MSDGSDSAAVTAAKAALAACDFGEQVRAINSVLIGQTAPPECPAAMVATHTAMVEAWSAWASAVASVGE